MNELQRTLFRLVGEVLSEGGNAADTLIQDKLLSHPDNAARDMAYSKISDSDLSMILPEKYGVFPDSDDQTYLGKILYISRHVVFSSSWRRRGNKESIADFEESVFMILRKTGSSAVFPPRA